MVAATPFTGNASQLLDLNRESLARFEAVTLTQRLLNGRNPLPVHRGARGQREEEEEAKQREKEGEG